MAWWAFLVLVGLQSPQAARALLVLGGYDRPRYEGRHRPVPARGLRTSPGGHAC